MNHLIPVAVMHCHASRPSAYIIVVTACWLWLHQSFILFNALDREVASWQGGRQQSYC